MTTIYNSLENELNDYLREVQFFLDKVRPQENSIDKDIENKILKGTFFVLLYGTIEHIITSAVSITLQELSNRHIAITDLKPVLWSFFFDPQCTTMEQGGSKKWTNRYELFSKISDNPSPDIHSFSLFPASNGNIKIKQIQNVWKAFGIMSPILQNNRLIGRLDTVASNRMQIAHGDYTVSNIGRNYTLTELDAIYQDISTYLSYIIVCFKQYIDNAEFKNV